MRYADNRQYKYEATDEPDMQVRDAVEADAGRLAELTDAPRDVMRNLIHDRTVRVAESDEEISGFVSFDARERTVHVTQLEGTSDACTRLLEEPMSFAAGEGMAVELLVPESNDTVRQAVEKAGFERDGTGPTFDGTPTVRFRHDPS
ncbi:Uncharacterized protein HSBGL_0483 [Halapricum desulfuricans]|uniref:N-acetyltransferase domain-containing protein n=2 Tax=Halapricum desulfuricans TaxID=2841257 RepID=A0A897NEF3_9EURY|nr:Uncharacterized protein HSBGL_0483 [Halapricum desulfuricans]